MLPRWQADDLREHGKMRIPLLIAAAAIGCTAAAARAQESPEDARFTLQLLHAADQEGGVAATTDAPRFSAVMTALERQDADGDGRPDYPNTLRLSSGDAFIPGVFFSASEAVFGAPGRGDILIQNELRWDAVAFGNHEFDLGTDTVAELLTRGETARGLTYPGAAFPYLSANLDVRTDPNLAPLAVAGGQPPRANSIAPSVVIDLHGEPVGVVGATTPLLGEISSPDGVTVQPARTADGRPDYAALARLIQLEVDRLLQANPGLNKVILLAHMQQIEIEAERLAPRLSGVDIIQAGGSNTLLADDTDRLRDGHTAAGDYPIFAEDADGNPVAVVNTDGTYSYVGRLVIAFDADGVLLPESYDAAVSGAYATDAEGVAALEAGELVNPEIQAIATALEARIVELDSSYFGVTEVYLDGRRGQVRTEETNLGNLSADANLAIARQADPSVRVSLKNGGGIRDAIGRVETPAGGTEPRFLPPAGNALTGKPEGGISQLDIQDSLRFNNGLALITLTPAQLLEVVEHAVAASGPGATPGQFPQVGGMAFSFDPDRPAGDRVRSLALLDADGAPSTAVVAEGEVAAGAPEAIRAVTLGFLAGGGDGYPYQTFAEADPVFADLKELAKAEDAPRTGAATFAPDGSEQDALAEHLQNRYTGADPFAARETRPAEDARIQNLSARGDAVLDGLE
jgi:2',3'-cyclic-nucleotide 2'-phosphodiesterase (5'-nucleotidase family)